MIGIHLVMCHRSQNITSHVFKGTLRGSAKYFSYKILFGTTRPQDTNQRRLCLYGRKIWGLWIWNPEITKAGTSRCKLLYRLEVSRLSIMVCSPSNSRGLWLDWILCVWLNLIEFNRIELNWIEFTLNSSPIQSIIFHSMFSIPFSTPLHSIPSHSHEQFDSRGAMLRWKIPRGSLVFFLPPGQQMSYLCCCPSNCFIRKRSSSLGTQNSPSSILCVFA